jgi:solute carrier family 25 (mitochondrial carrier protein), member 16
MAFHTKATRDTYPRFSEAFWHMYRESTKPKNTPATTTTMVTQSTFDSIPILKFYRGFTVTLAGMVPYAGVSFLSWGFLRARFLPPDRTGHRPPTPIADLVIGAVSGVVAQTASYPFEVIRRRMQVGGITRPDRWLRLGETVEAIWTTRGWRGFYVGLSIGYLKVVPMTAVSFMVWQSGKRLLDV